MNPVFHISEDGSEIEFIKQPKLASHKCCVIVLRMSLKQSPSSEKNI